jgi:hypothetical protein
MSKKMVATVVAGIAWGVSFSDLIPGAPLTDRMFALAVAIAVVSTAYVMMHCYQRPLGDAYEIGYEMGRRDAILEANRRDVSPMRRDPRTLGTFSIQALKAKSIHRERVDA